MIVLDIAHYGQPTIVDMRPQGKFGLLEGCGEVLERGTQLRCSGSKVSALVMFRYAMAFCELFFRSSKLSA
jgi:hypothetical protein